MRMYKVEITRKVPMPVGPWLTKKETTEVEALTSLEALKAVLNGQASIDIVVSVKVKNAVWGK